MLFSREYLAKAISEIQPQDYARNRNFVDGSVTRLSPFISRGVISTRDVLKAILQKSDQWSEIKTIVQQLVWREHFQHAIQLPEVLHASPSYPAVGIRIPKSILSANTGIEVIDEALRELYQTGYLHNHLRLYIASLLIHHAQVPWHEGAAWMYFHLLDADYASNTLSWQWVAGIGRDKKYVVNQDNINHYTHTHQKGTFWDLPYEALDDLPAPAYLQEKEVITLRTSLPSFSFTGIDPDKPTLIFHPYHLNAQWHVEWEANRILILPPSYFSHYPVSENSLQFILEMARSIEGLQIWTGEWNELQEKTKGSSTYIQEHPLFPYPVNYIEPRDFVAPEIKSTSRSFFSYWKKIEKNQEKWIQYARS
jgi:deoxyribodipyrimidine photo-lyase